MVSVWIPAALTSPAFQPAGLDLGVGDELVGRLTRIAMFAIEVPVVVKLRAFRLPGFRPTCDHSHPRPF